MGNDCREIFDYEVPQEIINKIPEHFYYAFGGEYVSISGANALIPDEDGFSLLDYCFSTAGYYEALKATCAKLDMMWLLDYWNALPWYHSDIFDGWLSDEVMKRFNGWQSPSPYYLHLIEK